MAQFKKGQSGNPAGRKPGTKNKRTIAAENGLKANIEDVDSVLCGYLNGTGVNSLAADFNDVTLLPKDRLLIAEKLMQYRFPKMQATSVDLTARAEASATVEEQLEELSKC